MDKFTESRSRSPRQRKESVKAELIQFMEGDTYDEKARNMSLIDITKRE